MIILAFAPHTDDIELGCGATIHKTIRVYGDDHVKCYSLSHIFTHPVDGTEVDLTNEWADACDVLNIRHRECFNFEVRNFDKARQEILQKFVDINTEYEPEVVIVPCTKDVHQDHQVVTAEAIRAFRRSTILGYILPWNIVNCTIPAYFNEVFDNDVQAKINAFSKFKSQASRPYAMNLEEMAKVTGMHIGVEYAEGFEPIRIIGGKLF